MRGRQIRVVCALLALLIAGEAVAQKPSPVRVINSVRIVEDKGSPALEILSTGTLVPTLTSLASPPRLVIELPNSRPGPEMKPIEPNDPNILGVHVSRSSRNSSTTRIVLDLIAPYRYSWQAAGNGILVRFKPPEETNVGKASEAEPAPDFSLTKDAGIVPVNSSSTSGARLGAGSSITAGSETTILRLSRGGEVRICPGTTVSVTASKSKRDLMFGISTGAIEAHYGLSASADAVLTPDFRIMFAGPGEFHFAISADSHGNTCVRALKGNSSSAIVSELMGDRIYQVRPSEEVVFRSGRIDRADNDIPLDCGCPTPSQMLRARAASGQPVAESSTSRVGGSGSAPNSASGSAETHASNSPEIPLPASKANDMHVSVDAPFVFNARDRTANVAPPPAEVAGLPVDDSPQRQVYLDPVVQGPAAPSQPSEQEKRRHGFLGRVKGFFSALFK